MLKLEDICNLIQQDKEKFGRIDILVNNAGQGLCAPVESIDLGDYRAVMELNVFAVLSAMQAVIPIMRQQGGGMILSSLRNRIFDEGGQLASRHLANATVRKCLRVFGYRP